MGEYVVASLKNLVEKLKMLPGIGEKSAQRLAYHIIGLQKNEIKSFVDAILDAKTKIHFCSICKNLTDSEVCSICSDENRDGSTICVVESPQDVVSFEKSGGFNFRYHVLHGVISPLNGVGLSDIYIDALIKRVEANGDVKEVIMATNPTMEGEATALYIKKLLKRFDIKVTRLACGVPIGGDLEYTDKMTLMRALEGRSSM